MLSGTKLNPGIWVFCSSRALTLNRLKTEQLDCVLPSQKCPWNQETYGFNSALELKLFLPITISRLVLTEGQGLFPGRSPMLLQTCCCFYLQPLATHKPIGAAPLPCVQMSGVPPNPQGTKNPQGAKPPLKTCSNTQRCLEGTDTNISKSLFTETGTKESQLLDTRVAIFKGCSGRNAVLN